IALWLAVKQARRGLWVLLLDRDNSRREVKRRLHAWGAAETPTFHVMPRDEVPPLPHAAAWRTFAFADYAVGVIDSYRPSPAGGRCGGGSETGSGLPSST